jgi:putative endonuclease
MDEAASPRWFMYLLECRGGRIYTGIATDVDRRVAEHKAGRGARFTRAHPPQRELARFPCPDRAFALRAEAAVKRLAPAAKRALAATGAPWPPDGVASPPPAVETVINLGIRGCHHELA